MILYCEWGRRGNDGSVKGKEIKSASLCFLCSDLLIVTSNYRRVQSALQVQLIFSILLCQFFLFFIFRLKMRNKDLSPIVKEICSSWTMHGWG